MFLFKEMFANLGISGPWTKLSIQDTSLGVGVSAQVPEQYLCPQCSNIPESPSPMGPVPHGAFLHQGPPTVFLILLLSTPATIALLLPSLDAP